MSSSRSSQAKLTKADRAFLTSRARAGGVARASRHSPLWKALCMRFLTERRLGKTQTTTYRAWLLERGFAGIAAECRKPSRAKVAKAAKAAK